MTTRPSRSHRHISSWGTFVLTLVEDQGRVDRVRQLLRSITVIILILLLVVGATIVAIVYELGGTAIGSIVAAALGCAGTGGAVWRLARRRTS